MLRINKPLDIYKAEAPRHQDIICVLNFVVLHFPTPDQLTSSTRSHFSAQDSTAAPLPEVLCRGEKSSQNKTAHDPFTCPPSTSRQKCNSEPGLISRLEKLSRIPVSANKVLHWSDDEGHVVWALLAGPNIPQN
jgi:hypothetical protein